MSIQNSKSKMLSVSVELSVLEQLFDNDDIQIEDEDSLKNAVLNHFQGSSGLLEGFVEDNAMILQWMPEHIHREAEAYHQAAVDFAKRRLHDKAIHNWDKAIELNPDDVDYRYKLALVLYEKKKYSESVKHLQQALKHCTIHHKAHLLLGMNWLKLRKIDQAQKHLELSKMFHANNVLVYLNLGAVFSIQKQFNEAVVNFEKCLELNPKEVRGYLGLARVYLVLSDREKANRYLRRVIELAPGSKMAEYAKNNIASPQKDTDAVIGSTGKISTAPLPENREDQFAYGMGCYIAGLYPEAVTAYKNYLQTHPSDDYAWYLLGESMIRINRVEESADCFKRAIRINDRRGLYYKSLGLSLHLMGKRAETVQVIKKAMELGKRDSLAFTLYGSNLIEDKKVDEGINHLQMAIKKNPNNPMALYMLAKGSIKQKETARAQMYLDQVLALPGDYPIKERAAKLASKINSL